MSRISKAFSQGAFYEHHFYFNQQLTNTQAEMRMIGGFSSSIE
jgi:hypothetical protein